MISAQEINDFTDSFPEFDGLSPHLIIQGMDEAKHQVDETYWGDCYYRGLHYLTAHILSPRLRVNITKQFGVTGKLKSYESKDDSKVEFFESSKDSNTSDYYQRYIDLRNTLGPTFGFY